MALKQLLTSTLPLNRKERFYTGTVLPQVALAEGGSHFSRLTRLVPGYQEQLLNWAPDDSNVLFFTEYSFAESVVGTARSRFPDAPQRKDTPDLLVLIDGAPRILIAIEAKMFHRPRRDQINAQLDAQQVLLAYLERRLELAPTHHCILLPERFASELGELNRPVITWEQIYASFTKDRTEDYFLQLLRFALEGYDELASLDSTWGRNADLWLTGQEVYDRWTRGEAPILMGRDRGLNGSLMANDIQSGRWRTRRYETRTTGNPPNSNWFHVQDFVERIARQATHDSLDHASVSQVGE